MNTRNLFIALFTTLLYCTSFETVAQDKTKPKKEVKEQEAKTTEKIVHELIISDPDAYIVMDAPQIEKEDDENMIHSMAETKPDFPGGVEAFSKFFFKNFKSPEKIEEPYKMFVQFVVEKDGNLTNIKAIRTPHPEVTQEALRVIKKSPKWIPGRNNNKPVRVLYTLPIAVTPSK